MTLQVADFDRKLDRPINDLDDIRIIMETQKKIRDSEIDMDMKIDLVEEAFSLLSKYKIQLSKEEVDKVESLEYNWLQLQGKAMDVQILLLTVQEHFQKELISNLEVFQVRQALSFLKSINYPQSIWESRSFQAELLRARPILSCDS